MNIKLVKFYKKIMSMIIIVSDIICASKYNYPTVYEKSQTHNRLLKRI